MPAPALARRPRSAVARKGGAKSRNDSTTTTPVTRSGSTCQRRDSAPNRPQQQPAVANSRSPTRVRPPSPLQQAVAAHEGQAQHHEGGADRALARPALVRQPSRQAQPGEHLAGRGDHGAMGQRCERKTGHEQQAEAGPGQHRQHQPAPPADAAQVAPAPAPQQRRHQQRAGREAQQRQVARAQAGLDRQPRQHRVAGPDDRGQQAPRQPDPQFLRGGVGGQVWHALA